MGEHWSACLVFLFMTGTALLIFWTGDWSFTSISPLTLDKCLLTVSRAESILIGVICWCYLDSSRGWENQDVCTGGILRGIQLRWLQIQRSTPAKDWPHSDSIFQNRSKSRDINLHHLQNICSVFSSISVHLIWICKLIHVFKGSYLKRIDY